MRKFLLYSSALVVLGLSGSVAEAACIQTPTCSSLGYTSTASCTGGTKCPFGNYWNCTAAEYNNKITELTNKITDLEKIIEITQQEEVQSKLKVGDYLYSDMTCSSSNLRDKTPIGVVGDVTNRLAIGLEGTTNKWSVESFDVPNLPYITDKNAAQSDWNGQKNTKLIWDYCQAKGYSCPAFEYVSNYKTEGTSAGDWFLPSAGLWDMVTSNETISDSLNRIGKTPFTNFNNNYWTSTVFSKTDAWYNALTIYGKNNGFGIIPIINFGKCTYIEPQPKCNVGDIFYSDKTCSTDIVIAKTPIGVVFDTTNRLIIGLDESSTVTQWSTTQFDIPELNNLTSYSAAKVDWQGKKNTQIILNYCKANGKNCPAIEYVNSYKTEGTQAGDWYLPSMGELNTIINNKDILHATLSKINGKKLEAIYWSSNEDSANYAWGYNSNRIGDYYFGRKSDGSLRVRSVMQY